jgi:hypothetical protein
MIPVGNTIIPPDPMKPVNTLSGIIGIQQQKQALQTGQYQQQAAQAQSQVAQRTNAEQQALATFTQNAVKDPTYRLPDGTPDVQKFQQGAMAVAPSTQQATIGQMTSNFREATENRLALQRLSVEQNAQAANTLKGVATMPNATPSDLLDAVNQLRTNNKDPAFNRVLDNFLLGASRTSPQQAAANGASMLAGIAQQTPGTLDTGGQVLTGATKTMGPGIGGFTPAGGVQKTLNPAQQPDYLAKAATVQGAAAGQVGTDTDVFKKVLASGANSQRGIELAQKVEQEAAGVRTGQFSQEFANRLTVLQQHDPSVTARQLLQKDAANLKSLAEEGATTDAERTQIGGGYPSPETMDPDALQKAARYWQGSFRMAGARRDNALAHVSQNGSTAGLAVSDSQFMKGSSPGRFAPPEPKTTAPGAPQEGARNTSKSGKPMIFTNGHWQYAAQ